METRFEIEQWVDAPIQEVFEHFTVAEKLIRWHGVEAGIEAAAGRPWWCRFEDGSVVRGEILEIDPPRRLVFTWGFDITSSMPGLVSRTPAGASRVEVSLTPVDGGTRVSLTHQGFVRGDSVAMGWERYLPALSSLFNS